MPDSPPDPFAVAPRVLDQLGANGETLVLAESCTGGMAAAALVATPGASARFAGSFVTYRNASKSDWLGIPTDLLENPGPVSREVAAAMTAGALDRTSEATVAAAITGHLGPHAPADLDGVVWISVCRRGEASSEKMVRLAPAERLSRQSAAATALLRVITDALAD